VVVLNFWASWCVPCLAEAPVLARLSRAYQGSAVRFPGVDVNDPGQGHALAFERHYGIGYPSLYDPAGRVAPEPGSLIPPAIPDTLVLDRTGHVAARVIGPVTYPGLRKLLAEALAEPY
jgi:thiol-disulfide isomerase/thioredoxin